MSLTRIRPDPGPRGVRFSNGIVELISAAVAHGFKVPRMSSNPKFFLTNRNKAKDLIIEEFWCAGQDLNLHGFRHTPLKRTCLPIPPPAPKRIGTLINYMERRAPAS